MINKGLFGESWQLGVTVFFTLIGVGTEGVSNLVLAQQVVTADPTLGTTVTRNGTTFEITGGTTVGGKNLFHSFSNFSVPVGGTADFLNAPT